MNITKRQKELIDFISAFIDENTYAPSIAEIQKHFSINSPATIHQHLKNLEEKGFIKRVPNRHRSIELGDVPVPSGKTVKGSMQVPILGSIAAGSPIESYPDTETVSVPEDMALAGETYVLRVRGDSMVDDHILDGDMVIVRKSETARPGDTVVALVDGSESTLKRYYPEGGRIRLQPANAEMEPMYFSPGQVEIQGIIVGILRRF
jgi:repressor LexA